MALKKVINFKGIDADYLCITDMQSNKKTGNTHVVLSLYASEKTRNDSLQNELKTFVFCIPKDEITKKEAYEFIKTPVPEKILKSKEILGTNAVEATETTEAIPAIETIPAVYETVETNIFANAIDC